MGWTKHGGRVNQKAKKQDCCCRMSRLFQGERLKSLLLSPWDCDGSCSPPHQSVGNGSTGRTRVELKLSYCSKRQSEDTTPVSAHWNNLLLGKMTCQDTDVAETPCSLLKGSSCRYSLAAFSSKPWIQLIYHCDKEQKPSVRRMGLFFSNPVPPPTITRLQYVQLGGEVSASLGTAACQSSSSGVLSGAFPPQTCPNEFHRSLQVKSFPKHSALIDSFRAFLHTTSAAFQTFIFSSFFVTVSNGKLHLVFFTVRFS